MAVAKTYQTYKITCDPYVVNSRQYVKVLTPNGSLRQVRWYTDSEYRKMYGITAKPEGYKTQKEVLGFNPSITIFIGDTYPVKEQLREQGARYHKIWGWYLIADIKDKYEQIKGITPIELTWDLVGNADGSLKDDAVVEKAVEALQYPPTDSEFVGEVGDRLELDLTVVKVIDTDGYYGPARTHIFKDGDDNTFSWTTAAKAWEVGDTKLVRGTVKRHDTYKGDKTTVLTRCKEM